MSHFVPAPLSRFCPTCVLRLGWTGGDLGQRCWYKPPRDDVPLSRLSRFCKCGFYFVPALSRIFLCRIFSVKYSKYFLVYLVYSKNSLHNASLYHMQFPTINFTLRIKSNGCIFGSCGQIKDVSLCNKILPFRSTNYPLKSLFSEMNRIFKKSKRYERDCSP